MHPPQNVVIMRALQLGDLLCAVPAFRALRRAWPNTRITLIGLPWARDFVHRLPYLDDFIEFPGFPGLPESVPDLTRLERFLETVRARQFDLAIQLHGNGRITNRLIAMLGAQRTAGFHVRGQPCPDLESFLPWPEDQPEIRRLLALTRHLGIPDCGEALELPILAEEEMAYAHLRAELPLGHPTYICLHPGARQPSRRWLPERFAWVADCLAAAGQDIVLTGAATEVPLVAEIRERMHAPAIDLAGHTTLGTLAAVVAGAQLVVCNDTGMSHVACAVGTPSVVISSGADAQRWRPLDAVRHRYLWHPVPCRPCAFDVCPTGHECAAGVGVDTVVMAALSLLAPFPENHHAAP